MSQEREEDRQLLVNAIVHQGDLSAMVLVISDNLHLRSSLVCSSASQD